MSKSGQVGVIGVIFLLIIFVVLWFVWLGSWLSDVGQDMITTNSLTGVEAFFFANLNMVVFIGLLLGTLAFIYLGGGT